MVALVRPALIALLALAAAKPGNAQVVDLVDDDGGSGVDFTDIQPAVDVAGPLDRIDVRAGVYGNVSIDKAVTIMGLEADANTVRTSRVYVTATVPQAEVVISKIAVAVMEGTDANGTILIDRTSAQRMRFTGCADVRLQRTTVNVVNLHTGGGEGPALWMSDSFVQLCATEMQGNPRPLGNTHGRPGGPGIMTEGQSHLVVMGSMIHGGRGGDTFFGPAFPTYGERGGDGIHVASGDLFATVMDSTLHGGPPGGVTGGPSDGPGAGIGGCSPSTEVTFCRTTLHGAVGCLTGTQQDDGLPSVLTEGGNAVGSAGSIEFRGRPGMRSRVIQGGAFKHAPSSSSSIPRLISVNRTSAVGPFGPGIPVTWNYVTTPFPRGTRIQFQLAQPHSGGGIE